MLFVLLGESIDGIGSFEIFAQSINTTNSTNAIVVIGISSIPVTYTLESFSTTYKKLSDDEIK
ncbi:MAG: hypothetical protein ACRD8K_04795 [Nitrososphaeraceae archaeon]